MLLKAALASATLLAAPSTQDEPKPVSSPIQTGNVADLGDVVVEGRSPEQVQAFVEEAAAPPPGRRLARWNRPICVGVANMEGRYARFMIDRIASVAAEIGVESESPGCEPNIMIIAASDANDLAQAMVSDRPSAFRPTRTGTDLGSAALERFQSTEAPVRWWHVSLPVDVDTGAVATQLAGEIIFEPGGGPPKPLAMRVRDPSRLRAHTRDELVQATVIIDTSKVGRIGFGALSEYVAMVALAQIAPDADTSGYETVLNLFSEGADRTSGLTRWDRDYLGALYTVRQDRARWLQQVRDISHAMTGE